MSIEYTYEIISVNEEARCMEVRYTSEGREPVLVGARLPFEGEALDAVVHAYSPVRFWEEQDAKVVVPQVGHVGTITPITPQPQPQPQPERLNFEGEIPQVIL